MSKIKETIIKFFNTIFRKNNTPLIASTSKQNYDEYRRTYDTLSEVFNKLDGIDTYLIGGISVAIQTHQDLYRQNSDIDIMCKEEDLPRIIETLQNIGYSVDDRRGIKTRNKVNLDGSFQPVDHELNADIENKNILGIGIFTYQLKGNEVITHSYAFDEKEGRVIGIEKIMPKELFYLMYDNRTINYKNINLKTQSKEYIYMTKTRSSREKDKLDIAVLEPILDDKSKVKINRIKELEAKTKMYKLFYSKDGKVESKVRMSTLEEKVNTYLDSLFMKDTTKTPEQIIIDVLQSDEYKRMINDHTEINILIKNWKEKSKNYTYQDKIRLLTKDYSRRLENFSKKAIDNALDFLQRRYENHGRNNNDIELSDESKKIFELMKEYEQSIKRVFVDNNIDITHITNVAPENLEDRKLKISFDVANNYETERVDGLFASSSPIDGKNPYIARNNSGMFYLGNSTYIYGNNNIDVIEDSGCKKAVLKNPNYIYYINPVNFTPVCNLTVTPDTHRPIFEFSGEWISNTEINIDDKNQLRSISEVKDITSLLKYYTVLCDVQSQNIGMKTKSLENYEKALEYIIEKINDGSVRNINQETGINDRYSLGIIR